MVVLAAREHDEIAHLPVEPVEVMDCEMHKAKVEVQWLAKAYRLSARSEALLLHVELSYAKYPKCFRQNANSMLVHATCR